MEDNSVCEGKGLVGGGGSSTQPTSSSSSSMASSQGSRRFRSIRSQGGSSSSSCSHPEVMKDLCVQCGFDLRTLNESDRQAVKDSASIPVLHNIPELKVSAASAEQLGRQDEERLLRERKLVLLVDLDQTVIHTTNEEVPVDMPDVHHFKLGGNESPWYHTKFRPGSLNFLNKMSKTYELHICTFGARMYAHTIASLLDPKKNLFHHRILSRDECLDPHSKTGNLKALFPCGDSLVAIIDDREDVWNFSPNVICVKAYLYFKNTGDINSPHKPREDNVFQTVNLNHHHSQSAASSSSSLPNTEMSSSSSVRVSTQTSSTFESTKDASTGESEAVPADDTNSTHSSSQDVAGSIVEDQSPVPSVCLSESSTEESPSSTPDINSVSSSSSSHAKETEKPKDYQTVQTSSASQNTSEATAKKEYQDPDDYLFYLEDILTKIHTAFYQDFDEKQKYRDESEAVKIPDLKEIIPKVRKQVLKGINIVFSGVIPTNVTLEKSRPYQMAKSLGANICKEVIFDSEGSPLERTTHVIAAKFGTAKVNKALKSPRKIWIVNPLWLFSCAERWERVDERVFILNKDDDFQVQKKGKESVSEVSSLTNNDIAAGGRLPDSRNKDKGRNHDEGFRGDPGREEPGPSGLNDDYDDVGPGLMAHPFNMIPGMNDFSSLELARMGKEVEDACSEGDLGDSSDSSDDSDDDDIHELGTQNPMKKRKREDSSDEDSLTCEAPRGWQERDGRLDGRRRREEVSSSGSRGLRPINEEPDDSDDDDVVGESGYDPELSSSSDGESSDSDDDGGAADMLEKEFLGE